MEALAAERRIFCVTGAMLPRSIWDVDAGTREFVVGAETGAMSPPVMKKEPWWGNAFYALFV
jgi:hypothetical protein